MYALIEEVIEQDRFSQLDVVSHLPLNSIIRDPYLLDDAEVKYVMNPLTHIDFVIFNRIDKAVVLAAEVDGYAFHKAGTRQHERDEMKNTVLQKYGIPLIRFNTTGSGEKEVLTEKLVAVLR